MEVFVLVLIGIIVLVVVNSNKRTKEGERLKSAYDQALTSGNKALALQAGRAYYSHLRKGKLTIYDEQAITNDLSAM